MPRNVPVLRPQTGPCPPLTGRVDGKENKVSQPRNDRPRVSQRVTGRPLSDRKSQPYTQQGREHPESENPKAGPSLAAQALGGGGQEAWILKGRNPEQMGRALETRRRSESKGLLKVRDLDRLSSVDGGSTPPCTREKRKHGHSEPRDSQWPKESNQPDVHQPMEKVQSVSGME